MVDKQQNDPKYSKVYDSFHMYLVLVSLLLLWELRFGNKMSKALKENDTSVLTSPLEKDIYEKSKPAASGAGATKSTPQM
ncbi:MAG: hypothetical protein ACLR56_02830 [Oscillospiraceae bacterium]